jgi:hypothetical protein
LLSTEAILQCGERGLEPGYDNVTSVRNREHFRLPCPQAQLISLSVVSQKRWTVKMFFSQFLVDCNASLGIGGRLET